ncbi:MAG: KH domain-containing protein [Bacilli bacterium]|nr:KH domain-containing protein [Bacilli bacterium]MDD4608409.1 KH domain-containing protein [Bacilli bacterium]
MKLVELTEFLVKSLVKDPEMVSVKQFDDEDDAIIIQVLVDNSDMGAVIGRGGNIANSIRTIVQASAYINGEKKVKINIDSF